jgi:hypothetical protein
MGVQIQEREKLNLSLSIAIELLGFQAKRKQIIGGYYYVLHADRI